MFSNAKTNDKVWDFRFGWGMIIRIKEDVLDVDFGDRNVNYYTFEGMDSNYSKYPSLFWDEIKFVIPEKPLPKLEVNDRVIVWDSHKAKFNRHFSHFDDNGRMVCFYAGATSWSAAIKTEIWSKWEVYEEDNK